MGYKCEYICDVCGIGFVCEGRSLPYNTAVYLARMKGWSVGKRGWICADCKKKLKERRTSNAPKIQSR